MTSPNRPEPGQVWDQEPTAEMRRENVTRAVRVESVDGRWVHVAPFGGRGRRSRMAVAVLLRKFTLRPPF
jgi:hypothetical protein